MKTIRIRMKQTASPVFCYRKTMKFHKGRTYPAIPATNQPQWEEMGKVFVFKKASPDESLLLEAEDYTAI